MIDPGSLIGIAQLFPGIAGWIGRYQVEATLVEIEPCRDHDLLTEVVPVDAAVVQKIRDWIRAISSKDIAAEPTANEVLHALEILNAAVRQAQEVRPFLQYKIQELSVFDSQPQKEKQEFIKALFDPRHPILRQAILGVLLKQADFKGPAETELAGRKKVAEWEEIDSEAGGYRINLYDGYVIFSPPHKSDLPVLLPAVRALCYFDVPSLTALLNRAHDRLAQLAFDSPILKDLREALDRVQCMLARVNLHNRGKSTATYTYEARWRPTRSALAAQAVKLQRAAVGCANGSSAPLDNPEMVKIPPDGTECIRYLTREPVARLRERGLESEHFTRHGGILELERLGPKAGKTIWTPARAVRPG